MVNFRLKKNNFKTGGFKRYRTPSVFGSSKKLQKLENKPKVYLKLPSLKLSTYSALIVTLIWLCFFSSYFKVRDVFVEGNNLVSAETLTSFAPKGKNIFLFNMQSTKKEILRLNPEIREVMIYKGLPNAIKLVVLEEDPKLIWQTGDSKFLVSASGKIAKKISDDSFNDLPILTDKQNIAVDLGQKVISPNFIAFIGNLEKNFYDTVNLNITKYEIEETTFDLNVYTEAGFFVKMNTLRSSGQQMENLKTVLVSKRADIHEYVDLRIDGWGYYK